MRNPGTRLGRPPKIEMPARIKLPSGERQGHAPTDGLDTAIPARAFPRSQKMASYHEDPAFNRGGRTKPR